MKGFGDNPYKEGERGFSLDDYARSVKGFCEENGIEKPCVIAHSFGARVAIKIAATNPDYFDKMVLTGAAGLKPRFSLKKAIKKSAFKVLKKFIKKDRLQGFYSKDYLMTTGALKESFKLVTGEFLDGELHKITCPTLIVFGREDKETPIYLAKRFVRKIADSRVLIIEGAGHFAFLDKPYKFNTEVREFLLSK